MVRVAVIACVLAACAPVVDGPAERARAADLADGDRLAAALAALPGAVSAHVMLHRPFRDPLTGASAPASAAMLVVVDDSADRAATLGTATALARATAPEIASPLVLVEVGAARPVLATVGPFTVERRSRTALVATLAVGLALIAALAIALARRNRPA